MVNLYLFLAYALLWLVFTVYAWSLSRRQAKLRREIEELKSRIRAQSPSRSESS